MGAFSLKISIAPSGETIAQIKKNLGGGGTKMGRTSSITMQVWWGSWVARRL